jgi:hypothetical protein
VAELETQVLDSKLEIDSLKASPVVSDEVDCADCSIFLANLALFKEKHASKCEELDVLRVEVESLQVVGLESLQVVRFLGILPLEFTMGMGGVVAFRRRGGTVHGLSFVVLVLLQVERGGSLRLITVLVFVEVALVGEMAWFVLTPLSSKWLGTGFALLVLTPVLSRLFAHVLVF